MPINILFVGAGFTPARWLRFAGIAGGHKARPYRDDFGPSRARNNDAVYKLRDGEGQRKKKSKTWAIFLAGGLKLHSKKHTRNRGITKKPVIRAIRIYLMIFSFRGVTICYPKD